MATPEFHVQVSESREYVSLHTTHVNAVHIYEGLRLLFKQYSHELSDNLRTLGVESDDREFYVISLWRIEKMLNFIENESEIL